MRITKEMLLQATGLADVIIALAQGQAKIATGLVASLTDNSGGAVVDRTVSAIPLPVASAAIAFAASVVLTLTGQPLNAETVTVGSKVYTFQTALTNVDGNVKIGATTALSLTNLINAINLNAGVVGTDYATLMTVHPTVSAAQSAGTTATLTAKTGGTAGNSLASTETLTNGSFAAVTLLGGLDTSAVQKAAMETALGTVKDALTEIEANLILCEAKVATNATVAGIGGTAADGTIGAITVNTGTVGASFAAAAGAITVATAMKNMVATLVKRVNALAVATGQNTLKDNSGGTPSYVAALGALSTGTGTAATGADATTNAVVQPASFNAFQQAMADAVKEMAAVLNTVTSDPAPAITMIVA